MSEDGVGKSISITIDEFIHKERDILECGNNFIPLAAKNYIELGDSLIEEIKSLTNKLEIESVIFPR